MVLLILVMMLVPLPALLLDLLFTLNIGMAIMVLIAALNVKNFKDFVSFPTLLLLTTLMHAVRGLGQLHGRLAKALLVSHTAD